MKGRLNREWHEAHKMPPNPNRHQMVEWHAEHAQACGCREIPPRLAAEVKALRRASPRTK